MKGVPDIDDFHNLACIREIVEDRPGTLMLPELVEKIRRDYATLAAQRKDGDK